HVRRRGAGPVAGDRARLGQAMPKETIPRMHIIAEFMSPNLSGAPRFSWSITMKGADAEGSRVLGYRATGIITLLGNEMQVQLEQEPQVHDEKRPVWTTMNPTDRIDIRKRIVSLAMTAVTKLKA